MNRGSSINRTPEIAAQLEALGMSAHPVNQRSILTRFGPRAIIIQDEPTGAMAIQLFNLRREACQPEQVREFVAACSSKFAADRHAISVTSEGERTAIVMTTRLSGDMGVLGEELLQAVLASSELLRAEGSEAIDSAELGAGAMLANFDSLPLVDRGLSAAPSPIQEPADLDRLAVALTSAGLPASNGIQGGVVIQCDWLLLGIKHRPESGCIEMLGAASTRSGASDVLLDRLCSAANQSAKPLVVRPMPVNQHGDHAIEYGWTLPFDERTTSIGELASAVRHVVQARALLSAFDLDAVLTGRDVERTELPSPSRIMVRRTGPNRNIAATRAPGAQEFLRTLSEIGIDAFAIPADETYERVMVGVGAVHGIFSIPRTPTSQVGISATWKLAASSSPADADALLSRVRTATPDGSWMVIGPRDHDQDRSIWFHTSIDRYNADGHAEINECVGYLLRAFGALVAHDRDGIVEDNRTQMASTEQDRGYGASVLHTSRMGNVEWVQLLEGAGFQAMRREGEVSCYIIPYAGLPVILLPLSTEGYVDVVCPFSGVVHGTRDQADELANRATATYNETVFAVQQSDEGEPLITLRKRIPASAGIPRRILLNMIRSIAMEANWLFREDVEKITKWDFTTDCGGST